MIKKTFLFTLILTIGNANIYTKDIIIPKPIKEPTLIKVDLDSDIYKHTNGSLTNIVLLDGTTAINYSFDEEMSQNSLPANLKPTSYDREKASITYRLPKPLTINTVSLDIVDENFETLVDIYIDDKLVVKNKKIFDYTLETGTRDTEASFAPIEAKEIRVVYDIDKLNHFYKKYKNIKKPIEYLSIMSIEIDNRSPKHTAKQTKTVSQISKSKTEQSTNYIFQTDNFPIEQISLESNIANFAKHAQIYDSNDGKNWRYINSVDFEKSSFKNLQQLHDLESRAKFLKIDIDNRYGSLQDSDKLLIKSNIKSLYFIAEKDGVYLIRFGDGQKSRFGGAVSNLVNENTPHIDAKLSATKVQNDTSISFIERNKTIIFIIGIVLAILILIYIAFSMLKKID